MTAMADLPTDELKAELLRREAATETIGKRVRRLRQAHGWITSELAERVGVVPSTINRLERGITLDPGVLLLNRVARAFDLPSLMDLIPDEALQ